MTRRFPVAPAAVAVLAILALAACDRQPPERRRAQPTADALAATPNAVGIPYRRLIVIRDGDRLLALRADPASQLGDRIRYRWLVAAGDGRFAPAEGLEQGDGEAVERPYTGRIALPGRLVLEWSRGSNEFGWVYWPERRPGYAVYSLPFADPAELVDGPRGGRWLTRDMFQD